MVKVMDSPTKEPQKLARMDLKRRAGAKQKQLKKLSDGDFIELDVALLACPKPASFAEDEDFAVLSLAIRNERWRRCMKHSGMFGWLRRQTGVERERLSSHYEKAMDIELNGIRKEKSDHVDA